MRRRSGVSVQSRWPQGAVLVGGAVRDLLRGRPPKDWDWAVPDPQAAAARLAETLGGAAFALDTARGYYRVNTAATGLPAQQHDFIPLPAHLETELLRRDFTVNALALHPDGHVSDPAGGQEDLKARQLRMVSEANLISDPLRLLRAARLSVTLGFSLEEGTREAVIRLAQSGLPLPAGERVRDELHALLLHPEAARGVLLLETLGLLELYLPELREGIGVSQGRGHQLDVFGHGVEALRQLIRHFPDAPLALRWATLLHGVGKPRSQSRSHSGEDTELHFHGHDTLGAQLARQILHRLREPQALVREVSGLIAAHLLPLPATEREARRFVHRRRALLPGLLALMLADHEAARARGVSSCPAIRPHRQEKTGRQQGTGRRQGIRRVLAALDNQSAPGAPLLGGAEVTALLALSPGPQVGKAIRALAEAQALGDVQDAQQARVWLLAGHWRGAGEEESG